MYDDTYYNLKVFQTYNYENGTTNHDYLDLKFQSCLKPLKNGRYPFGDFNHNFKDWMCVDTSDSTLLDNYDANTSI